MKFEMLHPKEIEKIQKQKKAIIVDLREETSYLEFHYKSAINIPYSENEIWLNRFRKNQVYILYCDYGNISLLAARKLAKKGIIVYTVIGGIRKMIDSRK